MTEKNKSVGMDAALYEKLAAVCETSGLSVKALAGHLIRDGLERIERGGGFSINIADGSIRIPNAAVPAPSQPRQHTDQPKTPQTEFPVREINMSAFKG
jgi:hypothetical protein